jgi:hypothetical protein
MSGTFNAARLDLFLQGPEREDRTAEHGVSMRGWISSGPILERWERVMSWRRNQATRGGQDIEAGVWSPHA